MERGAESVLYQELLIKLIKLDALQLCVMKQTPSEQWNPGVGNWANKRVKSAKRGLKVTWNVSTLKDRPNSEGFAYFWRGTDE